MTFFCIADKESSLGFKLSGIVVREALTKADAKEALNVALASEEAGIVLITEKISSLLKEELDALRYRNELPLILELPSRGGAGKRKSAGEFLKEAIGISI